MVKIRIIRSGKKEHYYLEHTIREGKRFRNKRKYLGNSLPEDIAELKENFVISALEETYSKDLLQAKKEFKSEYSKYPESYKKKYLEGFMVKFTFNTNKIEGGTLTLKETADLLQENITPPRKPVKDVREAEAHRNVFYQALAHSKKPTLNTVLGWHRNLLIGTAPDIAGRIRRHQVAIARSRAEMPLAVELEALLREFFTWYSKNCDKMNPVIFAALVHLKFVSIHPFSDGNGRISRLMMNHALNLLGYPLLNIEYRNRNAYYTALERSQVKKQPHIFVNYIIKRYLKEYLPGKR